MPTVSLAPSSPLGNDAERAMSEAGSLQDLQSAQQSILSRWDRAGSDETTRMLLRARFEERAAILQHEARQRLMNQLATSPFHATLNAPSPTVVDFCVLHPDIMDIASSPLPYDGKAWATFWTDFARLVDGPDGDVCRAANELCSALAATAPMSPTAATVAVPMKPRRGSWHVAVVGRRGVGRGALFQCLTGAGSLTDTDKVGARLLPVTYIHDDNVAAPTMDPSEVRRVWQPIRNAVADVLVKKPLMAAAILGRPDTKNTHALLSAPDWATRTAPVVGTELEGLIRYANDMLLSLNSAGVLVDQLVHDLLFSTVVGPPRVRSRFPWLRGLSVPLSFVDTPVPEPGLAPFFTMTLQAVLSGSATVLFVDKPRWEVQYATAVATPTGQFRDPTALDSEDEGLWRLLREYLDARETLKSHATDTKSTRWDTDPATPLHVVLSNDEPLPPHISALPNSIAAVAVEYSLWIARHRKATIKPHHIYVVSSKGANAVIAVHDEVCRRSVTKGDAYDAQAPGEVDAILNAVLEQAEWRRVFGGTTALPSDVCELLVANEQVWRTSHVGFVIQAVLHEAVASCTLPNRVNRLAAVHQSTLALIRAITDAVLAPTSYTSDSSQAEQKAIAAVKELTSTVKSCLLDHKRHIELLLQEADGLGAQDDTPGFMSAVQGVPVVGETLGAALSTAQELKDDAAKKLFGTRLSLASVIRTKVAAVTTLAKGPSSGTSGGASATATPAPTGRRPPPVAVQALNMVGARAAAALQGTSSEVGVISEQLRAWWCRLADDVRVGPGNGNAMAFRIGGDECVLRLCFGLADLAERFADNSDVRGNFEMSTVLDVLQILQHNAALDAALAQKPFREIPVASWSTYVPPKPAAAIRFVLQEHEQHIAPGSSRVVPSCIVVVDNIEAQTQKELRANLVAALAFCNEAVATVDAFEFDLAHVAAVSLLNRAREGAADVVRPAARGGSAPSGRWYPLGVALAAAAALASTSSALLSESFHVLSASLVRPDDAVAHLALSGADEAAKMLHAVSRLREFPAEWRRWRCDVLRQSSYFFSSITSALETSLSTAPSEVQIPRAVITEVLASGSLRLRAGASSAANASSTAAAPQNRDRSLAFDVFSEASSAISSLKTSLTGALGLAPPAAWQVQSRKKAVMCLCGGGVRGVLSAMFVQRIDSIIQAKYSVPGKKRLRIWDVCDEFYGTSTGAIVAALLAIGVEPSAIVTLYRDASRQIFPPSAFAKVTAATKPKYDPAGRFEVAKRYMGRRVMNDAAVYAGIARPKILICDLTTLKTKVADCNTDMHFVDALMAATAAPTYFPAHKIGTRFYCDAGIAENHPGLEVAKDMRNVAYVCTIGTGVAPSNYQYLANAGLLQWGPVFADVFIDATQTAADDVLQTLFGDHSDLLNLTLPPVKMELDDAGTIPVLMDIALRYMDEREDAFVKVADMLYAHTVGWKGAGPSDD